MNTILKVAEKTVKESPGTAKTLDKIASVCAFMQHKTV